ncbi:cobalamin B12-binding domain-containing protein [Nocardioides ungokensis]|uniref:cobalamin B12-binding domain-containing protein n=1 Tax=Nocardioides ungokensis TaxID=1643322 RepID=UPI0015DE9727|nr:cobalamin B12-binding domain-containing protein [Nocardioides ungokensis]
MDEDYWQALSVGDRHAAMAAVKRLQEAGRSTLEIVDELIVPAQARVGDLWLDGEWTVSQEHTATAINEGLVHWLGSFAPPPDPSRPLVLVSCIEGERHALPALVVAETLRVAGYRVDYLGGDPEPHDLLSEVLVRKPRAVLFSASLTSSLASQKGLFGSIGAIGIPVIVGGRAFGGDERRARRSAPRRTRPRWGTSSVSSRSSRRGRRRRRPEEGPADAEAAWILGFRSQITPHVVRTLGHRHAVDGSRPAWWIELEGHVDHVLGCLAAALVTGDESIIVEVRHWLGQVLGRRGGPPGLVGEIWDLLARPLRGHPLARVFLAGAAAPTDDGIPEASA